MTAEGKTSLYSFIAGVCLAAAIIGTAIASETAVEVVIVAVGGLAHGQFAAKAVTEGLSYD